MVQSLITLFLSLSLVLSCSLAGSKKGNGNSPSGSTIQALNFDKARISMMVGSPAYLKLAVSPRDALKGARIDWEWDKDFLSLDSDSSGAVISALKEGSTYVRASGGGVSATALVDIEGFAEHYERESYLYSNDSVIELEKGGSAQVAVSLYGGSVAELENLSWTLSDDSVASIAASRNNCVIKARKNGITELKAAHPNAAYPYTFVVYVWEEGSPLSYLTTKENILTIRRTEKETAEIKVEVKNLTERADPSLFNWSVIDDAGLQPADPLIKLDGNGDTALVTALRDGISRVRVSYGDLKYPLDILVRTTSAVKNVYISLDKSTLIVEGSGQNHSLNAKIEGFSGWADPGDFVWTVLEEEEASSLMSWDSAGAVFSLKGKKDGTVKVKVSHRLAEFSRTALIVLRGQEESALDPSFYITTSDNYIQTQVGGPPQILTASLYGGLPGDEYDFEWEVEEGGEAFARVETTQGFVFHKNGARAVSGGGDYCYGKAYINPLKEGSFVITVKHPKALYQTPVIVKVFSEYAIIEGGKGGENLPGGGSVLGYVTSPFSLIKMLSYETKSLEAALRGNARPGDENGIRWTVEDESHLALDPRSGSPVTLSVKEGARQGFRQSSLKAGHERALNEKRILVLSADTQKELDEAKVIYADNTYYRVEEGVSFTLELEEIGLSPQDIKDIQWKAGNPAVATVHPDPSSRLRAEVRTFRYGRTDIRASLPGLAPCVFDITVFPKGSLPGGGGLWTPPGHNGEEPGWAPPAGKGGGNAAYIYISGNNKVVRMLTSASPSLSARLEGNVSPGDVNTASWESDNPGVLTVRPAQGETTTIQAVQGKGPNQSYVSVKHPKALNLARSLILSADTQAQLEAMKAIYSTMEKDYFRINEGNTVSLIVEGLGLSEEDKRALSWKSSRPDVVSLSLVPGNRFRTEVRGEKSGKAEIRASLSGCKDVVFTVVVLAPGENTELNAFRYLSTTQNAVSIPARGGTAELAVTGVNIDPASMAQTSWTIADGSLARVNANGSRATITALKEGRSSISVRNDAAENSLSIDITVGPLYAWNGRESVYIETAEDVVTMLKGQRRSLAARLVNSAAVPDFSFSLKSGGGVSPESLASLSGTRDGLCVIEAREAGQAIISIRHSLAREEKEILLVIANSEEELGKFPYLSTGQNVLTVDEGGTAELKVSLENWPKGGGAFIWDSGDHSLVRVTGSGNTAQVEGLSAGTAKISVRHSAAQYPLEVIVNVVNPRLASSYPYISSPNIMTIRVGEEASSLSAVLVGGRPSDVTGFTWHIEDAGVVRLHASNDTAQIKALKEGVTQLIIRHPKARGIDRTVLIIADPAKQSDCVINVAENIIRMAPTDGEKIITANLLGGTAADSQHFKWWADNYDILDLNYSGGSAVLRPLSTGKTTVHISHPKAAYDKDVIVYISQYSEFAFEKSHINTKTGSREFVNLEVPVQNVRTRIAYTVEKNDGSDGSAILRASGTDKVCVLESFQVGTVTVTARLTASSSGLVLAQSQLLVNVEKGDSAAAYISLQGPTMITLEKGMSRTLKAKIGGTSAANSGNIQWKSDNPRIVEISHASPSLWTSGGEVKITARSPGECIIRIKYGDEGLNIQPLSLFVLVPGYDKASLRLDYEDLSLFTGEKPARLGASIMNPEKNDYQKLEWTVEQNAENPALRLSGGGKQVNIMPENPGEARIRCRVPSSGVEAFCAVRVSPAPSIRLKGGAANIQTHPRQTLNLEYEVVPASYTSQVEWTINDLSYASFRDDKAGRLEILMGQKEGVARFRGMVKASGTEVKFSLSNYWGKTLSLDKNFLKEIPVKKNDGSFDISYRMEPACGTLYLSFIGTGKQPAVFFSSGAPAPYDAEERIYTIKSESGNHEDVLDEGGNKTRAVKGRFRLEPRGEFKGKLSVSAVNPIAIKLPDGKYATESIGEKDLGLDISFKKLTYNVEMERLPPGKWTEVRGDPRAIILGDGETVRLRFGLVEKNYLGAGASNAIKSITINRDGAQPLPSGDSVYLGENNPSGGSVLLSHSRDWLSPNSGEPDDTKKEIYRNNTTIFNFIRAGNIDIAYRTDVGTAGIYKIPLYLAYRACARDYRPAGE